MGSMIYIISGPAGAGKSTTSKMIANRLQKSAYIPGDEINHMVVGGYEKPWLSPFHTHLIWLNIASLQCFQVSTITGGRTSVAHLYFFSLPVFLISTFTSTWNLADE